MSRTISTADNYLDSRDIEERIQELEDMKEENELDEDEAAELEIWLALKAETEGEGWEYGINFIHESKTEDYARETAEDIGAISADTAWPATCIDWERATNEFLMDYSSVEIDGETYYYREA